MRSLGMKSGLGEPVGTRSEATIIVGDPTRAQAALPAGLARGVPSSLSLLRADFTSRSYASITDVGDSVFLSSWR
jgi:hypothetical protein